MTTVPTGTELRDSLLGGVIEGTGGIRYHLRSLLGEGGQGWVYRANYDDPDGFAVVVKVLRPEGLQGDSLQRFEREAEVLRRLGAVPAPNPNIVRFYDYGAHACAARDPRGAPTCRCRSSSSSTSRARRSAKSSRRTADSACRSLASAG